MLKLYNTLTRKKEIFKPITLRRGLRVNLSRTPQGEKKKVNLFVCGITPYDFPHVGHARTYIVFDMIVKYLKQRGYNVFYLQNITDIDDKIINRAKERKITPQKLAQDFERAYLKDMKDLKIDSVKKYARATDHIKEIISQVGRLFKKGYAYQIKDGIYYDISKFKDYGKLSRRTVLRAEDAVSRIDDSVKKRNKGDFCLWKISKPREPRWPSPWGFGRPGWHIEDTAITEKYFGSQYDIHGGARDLIFPHHEAEIAQMEAISGKKPLVKCWLHSGFLTVKGQKMSKSLGNFITIKDFLKNHSRRILRLFIIKTLYRSPINYDEKVILQTKKELERIDEFVNKLQITNYKLQIPILSRILDEVGTNSKFQITNYEKKFENAMEDDFNTPKAIAAIFDLVNKGNSLIAQNKITQPDVKNILKFLRKIDKIFCLDLTKIKKPEIPQEIKKLVELREKYRQEKNWKSADEIRQKIKKLGYCVEDARRGPWIKRL